MSVLRKDLKEKSGRCLCSHKLLMCFLIAPGQTVGVACTFIPHTISDRTFYHKVLFVFFGYRPRTANNSFNFFSLLITIIL